MKYEEVGEVVNLSTDRYTTDVMLRLDAKDSRGVRRYMHLPLTQEVQCAERLTFGNRIRFSWEPELPTEGAPAADVLALQVLQSEAVASVRRAWVWTAGFAVLTNLAWAAWALLK